MCATMDPLKASDETDTTKTTTGSTPNSETASASSSRSLDEDQRDLEESSPFAYDDVVLGQLARQLEYYFSQANLEKDTYVETLRQLNDGYVPVTILQRFSKVQAFCAVDTVDAIIKAASEYSEQLQVVPVDTKTGKRVDVEVSGTTILAVGPISGQPLQQLSGPHPAVVPTSPKSDVQNTIIIREVDSSVTEADVRALFDELDSCPPIQSLYLDFANCWFVTLDTESRDDMLYVMMQLRSQYLGEEPVKARLKSLVRTVDPAMPAAPVLPEGSSSYDYSYPFGGTTTTSDSGSLNKGGNNNNGKKKQNKKNKGNNKSGPNSNGSGNNTSNNRGSSQNNQGQHAGGKSSNRGASSYNQRSNSGAEAEHSSSYPNKKSEQRQRQPQPDFSAESFPALSDQSRKVEVVVDGMDKAAEKPINSDSSSTTTTLSSSSSSVTKQQQQQNKQPFGGYAAALLKAKPAASAAAPAKKNEASAANSKKSNNVVSSENASSKEGIKQREADNTIQKEKAAQEMKATKPAAAPPAWGGGGRRSFADILRKEEATA